MKPDTRPDGRACNTDAGSGLPTRRNTLNSRLASLSFATMFLFWACGCNFLERNIAGLAYSTPEKAPPRTAAERNAQRSIVNESATVPIEPLQTKEAKLSPTRAEIIWAIPTQAVDGFVVYYGTAKEKLDKQVRVSTADLDRYEDPQKGSVFRYVLTGIAQDQPVFVGLSAYSGDGVSPMSEIVEIKP